MKHKATQQLYQQTINSTFNPRWENNTSWKRRRLVSEVILRSGINSSAEAESESEKLERRFVREGYTVKVDLWACTEGYSVSC